MTFDFSSLKSGGIRAFVVSCRAQESSNCVTKKQKATTLTPIDQLNKAETIQHYNAVLIEDLKSQFKMVIERSEGAEERTRQFIEELHTKTQERFDNVDLVLRHHSELFEEMDERFNKVDQRFDRLESRVCGLEKKMDEVVEAVQHHEKEIQEIKRAV